MNRPTRAFLPLLLMLGGTLMLAGALLWVLVSRPSPAPEASPVSDFVRRSEGPAPEILRVTLLAAKRAYDLGEAVCVDARGEAFFQQSHIPSALLAAAQDFDARLQMLPKDTWIISYCS